MPLASLYLGGGTPSVVAPALLEGLMAEVTRSFSVVPGAEITMEANPDDVTPDRLRRWRDLGIGRLSLGVQSLDDQVLRVLERRHSASQALAALDAALESGMAVSVDLMLAVPGLDWSRIQAAVDLVTARRPGHLSVYVLETDRPSRLVRRARLRPAMFPEPDVAARHYLRVSRILRAAGYRHYEVSSFALPGEQARHNSRYWLGRPVLAVGPGACGQAGRRRWGNVRRLSSYMTAVASGRSPRRWSRRLGDEEWLLERIMVRLRLAAGVGEDLLRPALELLPGLAERVREFEELGLARRRRGRLALSPRGWLLSNELLQELWSVVD